MLVQLWRPINSLQERHLSACGRNQINRKPDRQGGRLFLLLLGSGHFYQLRLLICEMRRGHDSIEDCGLL